ncbi:hypothetical protein [Spirosoma fluviale]|uniref:Uncharacterized protein n=1 Tax=Spirosoma fluviale TaxID=1597977 RepID=A0A286FD41_9BACT|nr:hypothetical protein [Spirosoma fluviale]SOD81016.1 hypothetical protein SAMN06269250_1646 [Spirosoma fluviale]
MATVDLQIALELLTPGTLRIWDKTPASAWGGSNPARSSVSKYRVYLGYPEQAGYSWEVDASLTGPIATGIYRKTAGELMAALGAADFINNKLAFRSGLLEVRIQAVSTQTVLRLRSNYLVRLPADLPAGALVWVKKEGVWEDITAYGSVVNGAWQWSCLDSVDLFTHWKLLISGKEITCGTALVEKLTDEATQRTIMVVLGEYIQQLFLVGAERQQWSDLVLQWLNEQVDGCQPHQYPKEWKWGSYNECKLSLLGQLLDRLEDAGKPILAGGVPLDVPTATIILKRVQAELKTWKRLP